MDCCNDIISKSAYLWGFVGIFQLKFLLGGYVRKLSSDFSFFFIAPKAITGSFNVLTSLIFHGIVYDKNFDCFAVLYFMQEG